jgi:endonuclease I
VTVSSPSASGTVDLARALARVEDYASVPYYDEDADNQAVNVYYADLPMSAYSDEWFAHFNRKIRETHTRELPYGTARLSYLYPWVDVHEQNGQRVLRSIYSGDAIDVHEVIRREIQVERERAERIERLMRSEGAMDQETLESRIAEIEARLPYNCEHVVPQSWFGKAQPMKADLHHLFTCEPNCNSFRSNIPYDEFAADEALPTTPTPDVEVIRAKCGRREEDRFEPEAGKGPAARATLYFLMRYPGLIGDMERELQLERLEVLLQWHEEDPPGIYEWHRNAAIQEIQGNRNPLIDYPDLARGIDFELGFGP